MAITGSCAADGIPIQLDNANRLALLESVQVPWSCWDPRSSKKFFVGKRDIDIYPQQPPEQCDHETITERKVYSLEKFTDTILIEANKKLNIFVDKKNRKRISNKESRNDSDENGPPVLSVEIRLFGQVKENQVKLQPRAWVECRPDFMKKLQKFLDLEVRSEDLKTLNLGKKIQVGRTGLKWLMAEGADTPEKDSLGGGFHLPSHGFKFFLSMEQPQETGRSIASPCGLRCSIVVEQGGLQQLALVCRIGGFVEILDQTGSKKLVGVTAAHGLSDYVLAATSMKTMSGHKRRFRKKATEKPRRLSGTHLEGVDGENRPKKTWEPITGFHAINWLGNAWSPTPQHPSRVSIANLEKETSGADFALLDVPFSVQNSFSAGSGLQSIADLVTDDDLLLIAKSKQELNVIIEPDRVLSATLLRRGPSFLVRGRHFATKTIQLKQNESLPEGASGCWVVSGNRLCGMIVARDSKEPIAYMVSAEKLFSDIKETIGQWPKVGLLLYQIQAITSVDIQKLPGSRVGPSLEPLQAEISPETSERVGKAPPIERQPVGSPSRSSSPVGAGSATHESRLRFEDRLIRETAYDDDSKKRLFVCCDGTWENAPSSRTSHSTNVARFARCVGRLEKDGYELERDGKHMKTDVLQVVWYSGGIGTEESMFVEKTWSALTDAGIRADILNAYYFLSSNYNFGHGQDEIILVGYSRGAFTVRCLAEFISKVGLLRRVALPFLGLLFQHWNDENNEKIENLTKMLTSKEEGGVRLLMDVKIKVLAEFDPVSATGLTGGGIVSVQNNLKVPEKVQNAFLAMALNEKRKIFEPMLWKEKHGQLVKQCAFLGCHGDIGGGNADSGLSQLPLLWMIAQVQRATSNTFTSSLGAHFDENQLLQFASLSSVEMDGDRLTFETFSSSRGQIGESLTTSWKVCNIIKNLPTFSSAGNERAWAIEDSLMLKSAKDVEPDPESESDAETSAADKLIKPPFDPVGEPKDENKDEEGLRNSECCQLRIHFSVSLLLERNKNGSRGDNPGKYYNLGPLQGYEPMAQERHIVHWTNRKGPRSNSDKIPCLEMQAQGKEETYLLQTWVDKAKRWWARAESGSPALQDEEEEMDRWRTLIDNLSGTEFKGNKAETLAYFFWESFYMSRDLYKVNEEFAERKRKQQKDVTPTPAYGSKGRRGGA